MLLIYIYIYISKAGLSGALLLWGGVGCGILRQALLRAAQQRAVPSSDCVWAWIPVGGGGTGWHGVARGGTGWHGVLQTLGAAGCPSPSSCHPSTQPSLPSPQSLCKSPLPPLSLASWLGAECPSQGDPPGLPHVEEAQVRIFFIFCIHAGCPSHWGQSSPTHRTGRVCAHHHTTPLCETWGKAS